MKKKASPPTTGTIAYIKKTRRTRRYFLKSNMAIRAELNFIIHLFNRLSITTRRRICAQIRNDKLDTHAYGAERLLHLLIQAPLQERSNFVVRELSIPFYVAYSIPLDETERLFRMGIFGGYFFEQLAGNKKTQVPSVS